MTTRPISDHQRRNMENRRLDAIDAELRRRVRLQFPIEFQLEIVTSLIALAQSPTKDMQRELYTDAEHLRPLAECQTEHRLAARLLAACVRDPATDLTALDVADDSHWPATRQGVRPWTVHMPT